MLGKWMNRTNGTNGTNGRMKCLVLSRDKNANMLGTGGTATTALLRLIAEGLGDSWSLDLVLFEDNYEDGKLCCRKRPTCLPECRGRSWFEVGAKPLAVLAAYMQSHTPVVCCTVVIIMNSITIHKSTKDWYLFPISAASSNQGDHGRTKPYFVGLPKGERHHPSSVLEYFTN